MRALERRVAELCRYCAYALVDQRSSEDQIDAETGCMTIRRQDLRRICGVEVNHAEVVESHMAPGVAIGLAVTHFGGEILFIDRKRLVMLWTRVGTVKTLPFLEKMRPGRGGT